MAWGKALLALLILVGVVWFFLRILQGEALQATDRSRTPWQILSQTISQAHTSWLILSAALYLLGLGFSALFWILLLRWAREALPPLVALRAYYVSHLGKYAPVGKGWALLMRVAQANQAGIRAGTAAVTTAYETLTTIAAGALVAALLLLLVPGTEARTRLLPALAMLLLAGFPIIPGVFNFLVDRIGSRFHTPEQPWPRYGPGALATGIVLTVCGWFLLGGSLQATLWALDLQLGSEPAGSLTQCTAVVATAYVAGFVASTPGGLGVRELVMQQLLAPGLGPPSVIVVILLRILWTAAELGAAGIVFWFPQTVRHE